MPCGKIKEVTRQVVLEKASCTRAGDALLVVGTESEVGELRSRQDNIVYEKWAARLQRVEAELEVAVLEIPDAESAHRKAGVAVEAAKSQKAVVYEVKVRSWGKPDRTMSGRRVAEKEIIELEGQYYGDE